MRDVVKGNFRARRGVSNLNSHVSAARGNDAFHLSYHLMLLCFPDEHAAAAAGGSKLLQHAELRQRQHQSPRRAAGLFAGVGAMRPETTAFPLNTREAFNLRASRGLRAFP